MYGFNIEVKLAGTRPDNLDEMLDVVTDQLTLMCAREAEFEDFMVTRHTSGDATFLIVVNRDAEAMALTSAIMWLHTAVSEAGFATPGWLRSAEQVFEEESPGRAVAAGC